MTLASEDRVGVALDQARKHGLAACVDLCHRRVAPPGKDLRGGPDGHDRAVADSEGAVGDHIHLALEGTAARSPPVAHTRQRGCAYDVQVAGHWGITAITSISISHSGWASPLTTKPVDTG